MAYTLSVIGRRATRAIMRPHSLSYRGTLRGRIWRITHTRTYMSTWDELSSLEFGIVDDKLTNFHLIWDFEFYIFPSTAGCFEAARGGNLLIVDYHIHVWCAQ